MSVAFPGISDRLQEPGQPAPVRRVREEVRDGVAVIAFSAAASTGFALTLMLIVTLVGRTA